MEHHDRGELICDDVEGTYIEHGTSSDPILVSYNEGEHNWTSVFLSTVLDWVRKNRPDLLEESKR
jgi:hypothetical protein